MFLNNCKKKSRRRNPSVECFPHFWNIVNELNDQIDNIVNYRLHFVVCRRTIWCMETGTYLQMPAVYIITQLFQCLSIEKCTMLRDYAAVCRVVACYSQFLKYIFFSDCLKKTPPPVLIFAERKQDVDIIHEYLLLKVNIFGIMKVYRIWFIVHCKHVCSTIDNFSFLKTCLSFLKVPQNLTIN